MHDDMQLVILEGRGCNRFLRSWAARFRHRRILSVSDFPDHVACHRNRVFNWFLEKSPCPYLLCMDDDVVPVAETEALLSAEGDAIGARAFAGTGGEAHPHAFSMAALKVHRRVIEAIAPPWFAFRFTDDGAALVQCECLYFHEKVTAAGFAVKQAGAVGHRFPVTVVPGDGGEASSGDVGSGDAAAGDHAGDHGARRPRFLFDGEVETWVKRGG